MYQADGYHPQADIDILLKDLQALINGNQAAADDLSVSDWSASTFFNIIGQLAVFWLW